MGVPALFRWLSKKYPKIVLPVIEEEETKIPGPKGVHVSVPIDITRPNPNEMEFDNLYLDMNGIVHPCTHPEGKPAPETEEEMMVEIFEYTERIVNMIRPRKLLFMAIDGVAPRAKMNQQRSRRFRSSQEAQEKEEARKEAVAMFEAMGRTVSEETKDKKAWDSNAITPGTPFMDLLAASLRYWVTRKINTDPGWKNLQVILSDASVPGEGEHKIMDFIRRQRTNSAHDPNTRHVIYGLDADLIMLSLATHEPHFRVLREDVFAQEGSKSGCRICGKKGHYAAQCTGEAKKVKKKKKSQEKKPFIFLDVAILREYLEVELHVTNTPFPFNLERAIDDWVLLIFFVGNDFLPHLPSLEIREGAIDILLKIWKDELAAMGGYLTNHGTVVLARAEIILEGLARREDDIFRRRREAEQRQDQNAKRRKIEPNGSDGTSMKDVDGGMRMGETAYVPVDANKALPPIHPSLPQRPAFDIAPLNPVNVSSVASQSSPREIKLATNHDVVANRRAIRLANMNAAEMLKAELAGKASLIQTKPGVTPPAQSDDIVVPHVPPTSTDVLVEPPPIQLPSAGPITTFDNYSNIDVIPGLGNPPSIFGPPVIGPLEGGGPAPPEMVSSDPSGDGTESMDTDMSANGVNGDVAGGDPEEQHGAKRKHEEIEDDEGSGIEEDEDEAPEAVPWARKVNPDGTVEQEDTVKLWEPGYKERYYKQKFGVELSDVELRQNLTKAYIEGIAWVLHYYYQGTPSWHWYYPYHYAPFASDFKDVSNLDIKFEIGQPFKAFEQLMGVFPAASRQHIPETFQSLMVDPDSPIIDFYPTTFDIDMNGKKMIWQGVALLPFIDESRLLGAMSSRYNGLTEDEVRRNKWGANILFVGNEHALYPFLSGLYVKRKPKDPIPLDVKLSQGIAGQVYSDAHCILDSTYFSPFQEVDLPDIPNNKSLSARYYYPRQLKPHQSALLRGVKRPQRILTTTDLETVYRRGGGYRGRGSFRGGYGHGPPSGRGGGGGGGHAPYHGAPYGPSGGGGRDYGYGSNAGYGNAGYGRGRGRGR